MRKTTRRTTVFNYTLRSNDGRLDFDGRFSNPSAPMLQTTGLFKERIARNEMEGVYTERNPSPIKPT